MTDEPIVHPLGLCDSHAVGPRTRIWAFAHVMEGAIVGSDCNLGDHTFVEEGATIGNRVTLKNGVAVWRGVTLRDDVFVGPCVAFTNDVRPRAHRHVPQAALLPTLVDEGASLGANATVLCGIRIGRNALIGAGSVVTTDVEDHALVIGNPARRVGWVCRCGETLSEDLSCACGLRYRVDVVGLANK